MKNLLLLLAFLSLFACKKARKEIEASPKEIQPSTKSTIAGKDGVDVIFKSAISPEWFAGRGTLAANMNGGSMDLEMSLLMRKDSAILLVLKKFGFEGARALITADSVFLINRLEQNYDKMSLDYMSKKFNLPAQFHTIQQLLLGNPSQLDPKSPCELGTQDSLLLLSSRSANIDASYRISKNSMNLYSAFFEQPGSTS